MRAPSDAQALALVRAITAIIAAPAAAAETAQAPRLVIESLSARDWASATFCGALHRLDLRLEGPASAVATALADLRRDLPTRDIPLPGHFVAEIALTLGDPSHEGKAIESVAMTVNALILVD